MKYGGVVLSGGKSSRMGTNKSLLTLHEKPVIEHITNELKRCSDSVAVITNDPLQYDFLSVDSYSDRYLEKGPLAGLETALYHIDADIYLCAPCDTPFINKNVYDYLLTCLGDHDAVIPVFEEKMHPLSGIYRRNILPNVQQQLDNNELKVRGLFNYINVNYINNFKHIPNHMLKKHFFNMNNPHQYEKAKHL